MWLLGNLFRTEKEGPPSGMPRKIFKITTDIMASSMQNYGILRDAILVTAELSDLFADVFNLGQRSNVCWLARANVPIAIRDTASTPNSR